MKTLTPQHIDVIQAAHDLVDEIHYNPVAGFCLTTQGGQNSDILRDKLEKLWEVACKECLKTVTILDRCEACGNNVCSNCYDTKHLASNHIQTAWISEQVYLEANPICSLAEIHHKVHCTWNHTDGCGYFYESWEKYYDNPKQCYSHKNAIDNVITSLYETWDDRAEEVFELWQQ